MLDIDGYRIDKGLTVTVDAQAHWSRSIRACAKRFGKENFYISGMYFQINVISLCVLRSESQELGSTRLLLLPESEKVDARE